MTFEMLLTIIGLIATVYFCYSIKTKKHVLKDTKLNKLLQSCLFFLIFICIPVAFYQLVAVTGKTARAKLGVYTMTYAILSSMAIIIFRIVDEKRFRDKEIQKEERYKKKKFKKDARSNK